MFLTFGSTLLLISLVHGSPTASTTTTISSSSINSSKWTPNYAQLMQVSLEEEKDTPPLFEELLVPGSINNKDGVDFRSGLYLTESFTAPTAPIAHIKTKRKGRGLLVSRDRRVNEDSQVLLKFFASHCQEIRPQLKITITGYSYKEEDGQQLEDFSDSYDVSDLIKPRGTIRAASLKQQTAFPVSEWTVSETLDRYIKSGKNTKSIELTKLPSWNFGELRTLIRAAFSSLGYGGRIDVRFELDEHRVAVYGPSKIGKFARAIGGGGGTENRRDFALCADYQMRLSAKDFFMQNYWMFVGGAAGRFLNKHVGHDQ